MNRVIKDIAMTLDSQMRGEQIINGNLTSEQMEIINEFVNSYNKSMSIFPLKRR